MVQKILDNRVLLSWLIFVASNLIFNPINLDQKANERGITKQTEGQADFHGGGRGITSKIIMRSNLGDRIFLCDITTKTFPCNSVEEMNKIRGRTVILDYEEFTPPHRLGWPGTAIQAYDTKNPEVKLFPEGNFKERDNLWISWLITIGMCTSLASVVFAMLSLLALKRSSKESHHDQQTGT